MPQQPEIQNKSSNDQLLEVAKKLLEQSGIDPNDFDAAISALNIAKQQAPNNNEPKYTNYQDKTEIYPDVNDACIYKRGDTKSGIWYFRIWNSKKKEPVFRTRQMLVCLALPCCRFDMAGYRSVGCYHLICTYLSHQPHGTSLKLH